MQRDTVMKTRIYKRYQTTEDTFNEDAVKCSDKITQRDADEDTDTSETVV